MKTRPRAPSLQARAGRRDLPGEPADRGVVASLGRYALLALVLAATGCRDQRVAAAPPTSSAPRNAIVIVMDTTRADRCSINGYTRPTTPALERFAADAVTFTDAWAPSYWTPPSHASLFTGLLPRHHGLWVGNRMYLVESETTLAERFSAAGYETGAFIANPQVNASSGLLQGFGQCDLLFEHEGAVPNQGHAPEAHAAALSFIRKARAAGDSYFVFLNHMEPHCPYTPPSQQAERFLRHRVSPQALARVRSFGFPNAVMHNFGGPRLTPAEIAATSDLYDAEIATLDAAIGEFLDALRDMGALDDTVVVITSDHGEAFDEHGLVDHMANVYAETLHVPLVIRSPGGTELHGGRREERTVRLVDVAPTVLELCAIASAGGMDGTSLLRDLDGRVATAFAGHPSMLLDVARRNLGSADLGRFDQTLESVYDGRHHLIRRGDGHAELYDATTDPAESRDLIGELPRVADELLRILERQQS